MISKPRELDDLLQAIMEDYDTGRQFFSTHQLPEYVVLEELDLTEQERALFLTFTCVTNHIHDGTNQSKQTAGSSGLWEVCSNLWQHHEWIYRPAQLVGDDRQNELEGLFGSIEIMDHRDPEWWYRTAATLYERWDRDPRQLLESPAVDTESQPAGSFDAPTIERAITNHNFPGLSGRKIRRLWLRLMHEEIQPLTRIETIAIPVDFYIVEITNRLSGGQTAFDPSDRDHQQTLRQFWQLVCQRNDLVPVQLYKPLWLLHKGWDDGGRTYLAAQLEELRAD
jgi:hypothetical protein